MPVPIGESDLRRLRARFSRAVVTPADAGYDAARAVWNARFDRHPGAIVPCRSADDVEAAVGLVRERNLLLAVRSGGHDYAGNSTCDAGLVIDLSSMKAVEVDVERASGSAASSCASASPARRTSAPSVHTSGGGGGVVAGDPCGQPPRLAGAG